MDNVGCLNSLLLFLFLFCNESAKKELWCTYAYSWTSLLPHIQASTLLAGPPSRSECTYDMNDHIYRSLEESLNQHQSRATAWFGVVWRYDRNDYGRKFTWYRVYMYLCILFIRYLQSTKNIKIPWINEIMKLKNASLSELPKIKSFNQKRSFCKK